VHPKELEMSSPEEKRQAWANVLKWIAGLVAAAVLSPIIFLALKGVLGLLALAVAAAAGFTMLKLAPWFSLMVTNLGIKLFIREVEANPIESMESLRIEKTQEAEAADVEIVEFETEIRNYDDQTKEFERRYPEESSTFKDISRQMHEALVSMKQEQESARKALVDLAQRIEKARAIYKMSLAAQRVAQLSKSAEKKVFQEIKEKVAFDAVQSQLNRSFSALNMAVARRKTLQASAPSSLVRNVQAGS
jgi:hypothetical protein